MTAPCLAEMLLWSLCCTGIWYTTSFLWFKRLPSGIRLLLIFREIYGQKLQSRRKSSWWKEDRAEVERGESPDLLPTQPELSSFVVVGKSARTGTQTSDICHKGWRTRSQAGDWFAGGQFLNRQTERLSSFNLRDCKSGLNRWSSWNASAAYSLHF